MLAIPWNYQHGNVRVINTCHLDTWLQLMFVLVATKKIHQNHIRAEKNPLWDTMCLLGSGDHITARHNWILWNLDNDNNTVRSIDEGKIDAYGDVDASMLKVRLHTFRQKEKWSLCCGSSGIPYKSCDFDDEYDGNNKRVTKYPILYSHLVVNNWDDIN